MCCTCVYHLFAYRYQPGLYLWHVFGLPLPKGGRPWLIGRWASPRKRALVVASSKCILDLVRGFEALFRNLGTLVPNLEAPHRISHLLAGCLACFDCTFTFELFSALLAVRPDTFFQWRRIFFLLLVGRRQTGGGLASVLVYSTSSSGFSSCHQSSSRLITVC
jgi:hypothetical protein